MVFYLYANYAKDKPAGVIIICTFIKMLGSEQKIKRAIKVMLH